MPIGHPHVQYAHEKMLNITNHQRNATQNHNKILPNTCHNGYKQRTQITNLEKRGPSYIGDRNVNWCSHCGKQYGVFSKN